MSKCKLCNGSGSLPSFNEPGNVLCDCRITDEKKYYIVSYMRIEPDAIEVMTRAEAEAEIEQARLIQPENIYRIASIDGEWG